MSYFHREPKIYVEDLPLLTKLLATYDYVKFNADGEPVAQFRAEIPQPIGLVTISYYPAGNHMKVFRKLPGEDVDVLNTEVTRDVAMGNHSTIVAFVLLKLSSQLKGA